MRVPSTRSEIVVPTVIAGDDLALVVEDYNPGTHGFEDGILETLARTQLFFRMMPEKRIADDVREDPQIMHHRMLPLDILAQRGERDHFFQDATAMDRQQKQ